MSSSKTAEEWQVTLGQHVRAIRLLQNIDQRELAERAGVGQTALKNLEHGRGARVETLIRVLRALDRVDWIDTLAPAVTISPLQLLKSTAKRQRVRVRRPRRV